MSDTGYLSLQNITLAYGDTVAVDRLDLAITRGELVALLGPSGCGKTTTMRAVAGLLKPRSGRIVLDGSDITRIAANRRNVGLVFQSYALFPHLSVHENVAFGLRLKKMASSAVSERVMQGLETVGLTQYVDRKPAELSGGQQQRVALARSLVMDPKVLLLDEPLSNLDARLRLEMRAELQRVQRATGLTMIFVTHDQSEALALADRIVVMNHGVIEQIGTPEEIYNNPVSGFVADFVGFENIFKVQGNRLETNSGAIDLPDGSAAAAAGLAWRPLAVRLGDGRYEGEIAGTSFAGNSREYLVQSSIGTIKAEVDAALPGYRLGETVRFDLPVERAAQLQRMQMIWIDTDMGFDDMLAVMMIARSGTPISGLSLVFGNTTLDRVERNTTAACAFNGWTFPVFSGAARSILGTTVTAQNVLGTTGMPTLGVELPDAPPIRYGRAFAALCDWLEGIDAPAPILALGPLTNIAAVLVARPDLAAKIGSIVWMGGSAGPGNHTASAEFNAFCDPEAIAIVLASGVDLVMVDLECCRQVLAGPDDLAALKDLPGERARVLHDLLGGYVGIALSRGRNAMALYDPVAAALAVDSTLADLQPVRIDVELAGSNTRGRTVVDARPGAVANARIATAPKADAIRQLVLDTLREAAEADTHVT